MGKLFSVFKKESTVDVLTNLEDKITSLESYTLSTREKHKIFAGRFLVASIGTYVIAFLVFYFYFFPPTWKDRVLYSTPLLLFPIVIITLKYCVSWYFETKIDRNNKKLIRLRNEKKQILQDVMNKETYKVALDILNTFGDKASKPKPSQFDLDSSSTPMGRQQLNTPTRNTQMLTPATGLAPRTVAVNSRLAGGPTTPYQPINRFNNRTPYQGSALVAQNTPVMGGGRTTPFPIIDTRKQNVMEKMIDFIISDGPTNRFAMICNNCFGHNGMALQEEFEYVSFRCAFCGHMNGARKMRPKARGLSPPVKKAILSNNNTDSTSSDEEGETVSHPSSPTVKKLQVIRPSDDDGDDDDSANSNPGNGIQAEDIQMAREAPDVGEGEAQDLIEKKND